SGLFPSDVALTAEAKDKVNFVAESWAFSAVSLYLRNPYTGMYVSSYFLIVQLNERKENPRGNPLGR
ncbi:MAG: hypothetical protein IJP32_12485, partial [Clostridia bacterium]|nr:hypothetical protein [Clostridia bacterium]